MPVKARLNYLRIAPRKMRLVADSVRGRSLDRARDFLAFTDKKGAKPLLKLLNQAAANARNNFQLDPSSFHIAGITVDEGPKYKRWRARSRGQVGQIQKKTSRITLVLESEGKARKVKAEKAAGPKLKEKTKKPKFRPEKEELKPKERTEPGKSMFRRKAF